MSDIDRTDILRIATVQQNPIVGDVAGNLAKAREARAEAAREGADLVMFTEPQLVIDEIVRLLDASERN